MTQRHNIQLLSIVIALLLATVAAEPLTAPSVHMMPPIIYPVNGTCESTRDSIGAIPTRDNFKRTGLLTDEQNVWLSISQYRAGPKMSYRISGVSLCRSSGDATHDAEVLRIASLAEPPFIRNSANFNADKFLQRFYFPTVPSLEACPLRDAPAAMSGGFVAAYGSNGKATIQVNIDEDGRPEFAVQKATSVEYATKALDEAKSNHYWPAMHDCKAVSGQYLFISESF